MIYQRSCQILPLRYADFFKHYLNVEISKCQQTIIYMLFLNIDNDRWLSLWSHCRLDTTTCVPYNIPHSSMIDLDHIMTKLWKYYLTVADAFAASPTTNILSKKPNNTLHHHNTILAFFHMLDDHHIPYYFFFLQFLQLLPHNRSPSNSNSNFMFVSNFDFPKPLRLVPSHLFRSTVIPNIVSNPHTSFVEPLDSRLWRHFWSAPLPPIVRNLWFHALHQSIPCKKVLYHIIL